MKSSTVISFEAEKQKRGYIGNKLYNMEENNILDDLLKLYIEKVDRDQSDLRKDISESEKRTEIKISEIEKRMDARVERIEQLINSQNEKMSSMKDNIDNKMSSMKDSVENGLHENKKFMWGIIITILLSIIGSIGVITATYFSTISLLKDML